MLVKGSRRGLVVVLLLGAGVMFLVMGLRESSPLRVGATPDEAWTHIHKGRHATTNFLRVSKRTKWKADTRGVESTSRYAWQKKLIAVRKTVYTYNTNTIIIDIDSEWDFHWPFK